MRRITSVVMIASSMVVACEKAEPTTPVRPELSITEAAPEVRTLLTPRDVGILHSEAMRDLLDNMEAYTRGDAHSPAVACRVGRDIILKVGSRLGFSAAEATSSFRLIDFCRRFGGLSVASRLGEFFSPPAAMRQEPWEPYADAMISAVESTSSATPSAVAAIVASHLSAAQGSLGASDYEVLEAVGETINSGMNEYVNEPWAYEACDPACRGIFVESVVGPLAMGPAMVVPWFKIIKVVTVDAIGCVTGAATAPEGERLYRCLMTGAGASAISVVMLT